MDLDKSLQTVNMPKIEKKVKENELKKNDVFLSSTICIYWQCFVGEAVKRIPLSFVMIS